MGNTEYKELEDSGTGSIINGKDQIWEMLWMGILGNHQDLEV